MMQDQNYIFASKDCFNKEMDSQSERRHIFQSQRKFAKFHASFFLFFLPLLSSFHRSYGVLSSRSGFSTSSSSSARSAETHLCIPQMNVNNQWNKFLYQTYLHSSRIDLFVWFRWSERFIVRSPVGIDAYALFIDFFILVAGYLFGTPCPFTKMVNNFPWLSPQSRKSKRRLEGRGTTSSKERAPLAVCIYSGWSHSNLGHWV